MSREQELIVADGVDDSVLDGVMFIEGLATITVAMSSGSAEVYYTCNMKSQVLADVTDVWWIPWDHGTVSGGTPGIGALVAPITAIMVNPTGNVAYVNAVIQAP